MFNLTINVDPMDPASVEALWRNLAGFERWMAKKANELTLRLAALFQIQAQVRFDAAVYNLYDDHSEIVDAMMNSDGSWTITARGEAVCFVEFGAGVHYNGVEPYPNGDMLYRNRAEGIVGIGEYGAGNGKKDGWYYKHPSDGGLAYTYGTKAAMPMWHAADRVRSDLVKIANEVFKA